MHVPAAANVNRSDSDPTNIGQYGYNKATLERAWQAVETLPDDQAEVYYLFRVDFAVMSRDPERMRDALETWPENLRSPGHAPEVYNISRAEVMLLRWRNRGCPGIVRGNQGAC